MKESVIFLATIDDNPAGFVQLYPIFSSVQIKRAWLLNDLYVDAPYRKHKIASHLMQRAKEFAEDTKSAFIVLETLPDNHNAQALYKKQGYPILICSHIFQQMI